jgi:hypothetical protein
MNQRSYDKAFECICSAWNAKEMVEIKPDISHEKEMCLPTVKRIGLRLVVKSNFTGLCSETTDSAIATDLLTNLIYDWAEAFCIKKYKNIW